MSTFVKVDGKWFNPEHVVAVFPGRLSGDSIIVTRGGDYTVQGTPDDVIKELCK